MVKSSLSDQDLEFIFSSIASKLQSPRYPREIMNDAEDIANLACAKAAEKWDPARETDQKHPGLRLAQGITWKLILKWYGKKKPILAFVPGENGNGGDPLENLIATTVDPADEAIERIEPSETRRPLNDCISEFLDDLPEEIKCAFVAHWAFGLPIIVCWAMIKHSPSCAKYREGDPRNAWQEVFEPILRGLKQYLKEWIA
jgi:hypothetical protein